MEKSSLVPRPYFYIKVTGAKNIFRSSKFHIKKVLGMRLKEVMPVLADKMYNNVRLYTYSTLVLTTLLPE